MATRCNIIIKKQGFKDAIIYHHNDGDLVGEWLKEELNGQKFKFPNSCASYLCHLYGGDNGYMHVANLSGDIEYLYTIDLDENTILSQHVEDIDDDVFEEIDLSNF